MNIVEQLIDTYIFKEQWHRHKLSRTEAEKYFKRLIQKGSIIYHTEDGKIIAYLEFWKVNLLQLTKILKGDFSAYLEDVKTGNICYVANTYIHSEYRNGNAYKILRNRLFELNKDCCYIVGEDSKRNNRLRIHRRT